MKLLPLSGLSRRLDLLAPEGADVSHFERVERDRSVYERMLTETQRLRGRVYVTEGNLQPEELTPDGRHVQPADRRSWHLLSVGAGNKIQACGRILVHADNVSFAELGVAHSALAQSQVWGRALMRAVESEIQAARKRRVGFFELGGWAIEQGIRCTTEAVRMVLAGYALAELIGGAIGISTADACNHSASILRRLGGRSLTTEDEQPLPRYYEPAFRRDLDILRFDSATPKPSYGSRVAECRSQLRNVTVVCATPAGSACRTRPGRVFSEVASSLEPMLA